jgi:hypothetical protein
MNKLKEQNEKYLSEIASLKEQIKHLNENTVIQSMNDMKEQYEKLKREYHELRFDNKRLLKSINAIEIINNLILRKLFDISYFEGIEKFLSSCGIDISDITKNSRLIDEIITDIKDDHECNCKEH